MNFDLLLSPILFLIITKILTSPRPIMGLSSDQFLSDLIFPHIETEEGPSIEFKFNAEYKGDSSPKLSPIFILLPNTILTSPHADTGHECSLIGSYPISPVLIWFKFNSSGNRTGLLWYLIMDYHPAVIRNFDQCIPRCITITCSESTQMCCPIISIELFPNL